MNPEEDEPVKDIIAEALADHSAGPVKKSRLLLGLCLFSLAWMILCVYQIFISLISEPNLELISMILPVVIVSPIIGVVVFVIGFLRRYRFRLGKTTERLGIAVLLISVANMTNVFILNSNL